MAPQSADNVSNRPLKNSFTMNNLKLAVLPVTIADGRQVAIDSEKISLSLNHMLMSDDSVRPQFHKKCYHPFLLASPVPHCCDSAVNLCLWH